MSLKDFQILSKLGEGAYSSVYKVKRLIDNVLYAMKKVKLNTLSQREQENALNEVRILASIHHINVIGYKQVFIDKNTNYLYIIMEYADNGDLYEHIQEHIRFKTQFDQPAIWRIFIQVVRGLKVLHEMRILHRDLKCANIFLFKNGIVKIGDLNVSKLMKGLSQTQTGTPYYASPQVWKDQPYDKKSDMWSLGCVIYEAITLKPPFRANDMEGLQKKVIRGFYTRIPPEYSEQLSAVLKLLLQVNPYQRSSCEKLLDLPIVNKHTVELPIELPPQQFTPRGQLSLLDTIKFQNKLMKSQPINLPKPRYFNTIDAINHRIPVSKTLNTPQEDSLDHLIQGEFEGYTREASSLHKNDQRHNKNKNVNYSMEKPNFNVQNDKKLPEIYQGRLRGISPVAIHKILKSQKQKNKIYSIIGKY